jgi:hypothetical protein
MTTEEQRFERRVGVVDFRMYLAGGTLLFFIGVTELGRGIGDGNTTGILVGLTFLLAAALCLYQARSEKRHAEQQAQAEREGEQQAEQEAEEQAEISRPDATEAPREPGRPQ